MAECLEEAARDMATVAENLNSTRSPCCQEKARFQLWDDEDEARLHRRVTSVVKRVEEILIDYHKVRAKRKEATND
tara:strand:- start:863 stop:1090 length:228 start_codon:yes stop_codon:yes gene_type:complete